MTAALSPDDIAALQSYAAERGRKWKQDLALDWYNARASFCAEMPDRGAILHGLRNNLGPTWLEGFKFPAAPYRVELTDAGEQMVIPGCERDLAPGVKQLDLF